MVHAVVRRQGRNVPGYLRSRRETTRNGQAISSLCPVIGSQPRTSRFEQFPSFCHAVTATPRRYGTAAIAGGYLWIRLIVGAPPGHDDDEEATNQDREAVQAAQRELEESGPRSRATRTAGSLFQNQPRN